MSDNANNDDIHLPDLGDQSSSHLEGLPSVPPSTGTRRARVEDDDGDILYEERERNRPRIQVENSTDPQTSLPQPTSPQASNPLHVTSAGQPETERRTPHITVARTTMQFTLSTTQQEPFAQVNVVFDSSPIPSPNQSDVPNPRNAPPTEFTFDSGPISGDRVVQAFNQLLATFPIRNGAEDRSPDLARAKIILDALERIPRGLIQRMDVVGGVMGSVSDTSSEHEESLCAVCWESLLSNGSFTLDNTGPDGDASAAATTENPVSTSFSPEEREALASDVISLPCRHLFHGSCLVPWLSRQTTCPSCRFNLDPENVWQRSTHQFWIPPAAQQNAPREANRPTDAGRTQDSSSTQPPVPIQNTTVPVPLQSSGDRGPEVATDASNEAPTRHISMIVVEVGHDDESLESMTQGQPPTPAPAPAPAPASTGPNPTSVENDTPDPNFGGWLQVMPPELQSFFATIFESNRAPGANNSVPQARPTPRPATMTPNSTSELTSPQPHSASADSQTVPPTPRSSIPQHTRTTNLPMAGAASAAGALVRSLVAAIANPVQRSISGVGVMPVAQLSRNGTPSVSQSTGAVPVPRTGVSSAIPLPRSAPVPQGPSNVPRGTNPIGTVSHSGNPVPNGQVPFGRTINAASFGDLPRPATAPTTAPSQSTASTGVPLLSNFLHAGAIPFAMGVFGPTPPQSAMPMPNGTANTTEGLPFTFQPIAGLPQGMQAPVPNPNITLPALNPSGTVRPTFPPFNTANLPSTPASNAPPTAGTIPLPNNGQFLPPFSFPLPAWPPFMPQGVGTQPTERKKWTIPDGRGTSIRQRVESKERDIGLRCCDPSCGLAPTDDVPSVSAKIGARVSVLKDGDRQARVCNHTFHSGCLVSAARVAGFHPQGDDPSQDVAVPCTVCRIPGHVDRGSWDDGVRQLELA